MPNSSTIRRASPKNTKGKGLSHQEFMQRRHDRRKKKDKRSVQQKKKDLLREYMSLNDTEENTDNKTAARKIMDLVEEINENGRMTDHSYLQIMDQLMALNKGTENSQPVNAYTRRTPEGDIEINTHDYYVDNYIIDRVGTYREMGRRFIINADIENYINR
jgi:ribosome-binding ATPase YchF (GTP1/OBG family)